MDQSTKKELVARPITGGKYIDKVAWTHIRDGKMLMGRPKGGKHFINIGGKRNAVPGTHLMETDVETLVREVREETSGEIIPETAVFIHLFKGTTATNFPLWIACYAAEHIGFLTPQGEMEELQYLCSEDADLTTPMGAKIFEWYKDMRIIR